MTPDLLPHGVDLAQGAFDDLRTGERPWHPDGEEQGVDTTFAHPRDVDVAGRRPRSQVEVFQDHLLGRVGVGIEDECPRVNFASAFRHLLCGGGCYRRQE